MPKSSLKPEQCERLLVAMRRSQQELEVPRQHRLFAIKQYVGSNYNAKGAESRNGIKHHVPVNLIARYVQIVGRNLIAKNPKVLLSTFLREHATIVSAMESWCNEEIERSCLDQTLQRVVIDALFSIGICKVAIAGPGDNDYEAGMPFVCPVDLDDFVFDPHCRDMKHAAFMGHRVRVPLEVVRGSKLYSAEARALLQATVDKNDDAFGERVSAISRSRAGSTEDEFEDHVDLWEVYVPRLKKVFTFSGDQLDSAAGRGDGGFIQPLREHNWVGPAGGPYHLLGFGCVPGNALPKAPVHDLIDNHMWLNRLYRKLQRQSENQKSHLFYASSIEEQMKKVKDSPDGSMIPCDDPSKIGERGFRGPNQILIAMAMQVEKLLNEQAGNLDLMGGTANASPTATQDKMLNANASQVVANMRTESDNFAASVCKSLCWFWHHNPTKQMLTQYTVQGFPGLSEPLEVSPDQRQAVPFEQLGVKVDVYSMMPTSPAARLQTINGFLAVIQPFMGLAAESGIQLDINELFSLYSRYGDLPELKAILTMRDTPTETTANQEVGSSMPPNTSRTYNRTSSSEMNKAGQETNAIQSMMGKDTGGNPYEGDAA